MPKTNYDEDSVVALADEHVGQVTTDDELEKELAGMKME